MVTLAGTQNLNEFELHLRAVLGLPIPEITFERSGPVQWSFRPRRFRRRRITRAWSRRWLPIRVSMSGFSASRRRALIGRMGVVVGYAPLGSDLDALRDRVKAAAAKVRVVK